MKSTLSAGEIPASHAIPPQPELAAGHPGIASSITELVGNTPLLRLNRITAGD
jgi:hypothetical protein